MDTALLQEGNKDMKRLDKRKSQFIIDIDNNIKIFNGLYLTRVHQASAVHSISLSHNHKHARPRIYFFASPLALDNHR